MFSQVFVCSQGGRELTLYPPTPPYLHPYIRTLHLPTPYLPRTYLPHIYLPPPPYLLPPKWSKAGVCSQGGRYVPPIYITYPSYTLTYLPPTYPIHTYPISIYPAPTYLPPPPKWSKAGSMHGAGMHSC